MPPLNYHLSLLLLIILFLTNHSTSSSQIAKFEVDSFSVHSVVVRMVGGENVSRLDMRISIFDLDRLKEFRHSELTAAYHGQIFSFDGLSASTWFAVRIEYQLQYKSTSKGRHQSQSSPLSLSFPLKDSSRTQGARTASSTAKFQREFPTKQELIVRTREDPSEELNAADNGDHHSKSTSVTGEESIIRLEGITSSPEGSAGHDTFAHLNVSLATIFPLRSKLKTLIVPELRCYRGTVKPPAMRILTPSSTIVTFDVGKSLRLGGSTNRNGTTLKAAGCFRLCVFPFVRAEIAERGEETFKGKELCVPIEDGTVTQGKKGAAHRRGSTSPRHLSSKSGGGGDESSGANNNNRMIDAIILGIAFLPLLILRE